jgi:uncharacterized protein YeaO (DUF488 family)
MVGIGAFDLPDAARWPLEIRVLDALACARHRGRERRRMIALKRAYEPAAKGDGRRVLVERLWPRGVSRAKLRLDEWAKDVAPSPELRRWFGHEPAKWPEFRRRYFAELRGNAAAWQPLLAAARRGRVTFIYAARDEARNGAVALKAFLDRRL